MWLTQSDQDCFHTMQLSQAWQPLIYIIQQIYIYILVVYDAVSFMLNYGDCAELEHSIKEMHFKNQKQINTLRAQPE